MLSAECPFCEEFVVCLRGFPQGTVFLPHVCMYVSVFLPCDRLVTCQGCFSVIHPLTAGMGSCTSPPGLRISSSDNGRMCAPNANLSPSLPQAQTNAWAQIMRYKCAVWVNHWFQFGTFRMNKSQIHYRIKQTIFYEHLVYISKSQ